MLRPSLNNLLTAWTNSNYLCKIKIVSPVVVKFLHLTSQNDASRRDLRTHRMNVPKKDDGLSGEKVIDIDDLGKQEDLYPDVNTPNRLFNGIPYKELPIINIKATPNNTIMSLSDFKGLVHVYKTCGTEGFRTAKKGTNVAAQTTAINISKCIKELGVRTVRVKIQGLGPGRMAALKGVQVSGIEIVSVTDDTPISWNPHRPRKARRV